MLLLSARILGAEGRGVFAFFLLWPTFGSYLLALGIPGANLKFAAESSERVPDLIWNSIAITFTLGAFVAITLAFGIPTAIQGPMSDGTVWVALAATLSMMLFNALTWIQMGCGEFVVPSILKGLLPGGSAIVLASAALFAKSPLGPADAAIIYAMASAGLACGVLVHLVIRHGRPVNRKGSLKASLRYGVAYQFGLIAQLVTYRADQWILGLSATPASLGVYSVAASTSEVATYGATAKGMTRFHEAAAGHRERSQRTILVVAGITAASALAVVLASALLLTAVFGPDFSEAVLLVCILAPGTVGIGLLRVCGNELSGRGRPGAVSVLAAVQAVAMLAGFVLLVPPYGAIAAAAVSSVGYVVGGVACAILLLRSRA